VNRDLVGGIYQGRGRVAHHIAPAELASRVSQLVYDGYRLALVAAHDDGLPLLRVVYLFVAGAPDRRVELHVTLTSDAPMLPSLASQSFAAGRFEREMADLYGVTLIGHPSPKRLVRHAHWPEDWHPMRHDAGSRPPFPDRQSSYPFTEVVGPGVYEIPVGPIHAGLIEPGHFRFSVVGETVVKLTARLWFLHRGIEKLFEGRHATDAVDLAERISGDTSAAHALAHALAVEDALGISVADDAHLLRSLLVELERLYNHATDLGALANDVGYGIAHSHAQHVREELLRINHTVTGHRLLRGAIHPGGVRLRALPQPERLRDLAADIAEITDLTLANSIVRDRFTGTAVLTAEHARDFGCLGYVARASGLVTDARLEHPTVDLPVTVARAGDGDVLARYTIRRDEFAASVDLACHLIERDYPTLDIRSDAPIAATGRGPRSGVGIVEGWRGTIVHRIETDPDAILTRAKIVDPSWINWPALPIAMTDTIVPDFPLANKSFNLAYAGNDL